MTFLTHPTFSRLWGDRYTTALGDWRAAATLVSARWAEYRMADREARDFAFRAYVAALDDEEAAADELARLTMPEAA
jgi:hypothetical protein